MFSDPVKTVEQCSLQPGMEIADLGSGSGHYSIAIARALASTGRVYSIDINKDALTRLKNNAVKEGLFNVEVIWGDIDKLNGTKLKDYSVDFAFFSNILFQLENKETAVDELKRILKPGGKVLVVDWSDSFGGLGPEAKSVVSKAAAVSLFEKKGFHLDREISAGAHHYGLIYKKL